MTVAGVERHAVGALSVVVGAIVSPVSCPTMSSASMPTAVLDAEAFFEPV